ncbi:MAG: carboxypeptidase regulatory-like domain-containing protein [Chloroflexi bacterium]|nr:carboxypeptidase regulatory-like domain-containing protein [Chloroflexota bacterium]MBP8055453.1 carboxypeptidase regulatory-like domain-containing protein [Chloroflexota bacterium]
MRKKWFQAVLLAGIVLTLMAPFVLAQAGSIRGSVREDKDGDGKCADGAAIVGVPIEFISNDGQWSHVLYTGDDGSYGLVAVNNGTWTVTAKPAAEWVVTSTKSLKPFVGDENPVVLNVNFCIRKAASVGTGTTVLPQSGSALPTGIMFGLTTGVALVGVGVVLEGRRRFQS